MSDYKLNKNERIDVEEILKDLEHYHPHTCCRTLYNYDRCSSHFQKGIQDL